MAPVDVLYQTIWFRSGRAYVPSIGRPPSGMFVEVEPVEIVDQAKEAFARAVAYCLSRPFVRIPERDRFAPGDWPPSVVQRAAGFKSWRSFSRGCLSMALIRGAGKWQISVGDGGAEDIETIVLPLDSATDSIVEMMASISDRYSHWKN